MRKLDIITRTDRGQFITDTNSKVDEETARLLYDYLTDAYWVLSTGYLESDLLDSSKGRVVPISWVTDGQWLWNDEVGYYVKHYLLSPGREFIDHCKSNNWKPPKPHPDQIAEALDMLQVGPGSIATRDITGIVTAATEIANEARRLHDEAVSAGLDSPLVGRIKRHADHLAHFRDGVHDMQITKDDITQDAIPRRDRR